MPLLAPNVNSYRRLRRYSTAPINVHWGIDNRTVGLRVPMSEPEARRVENRVAGADANPYLAIAASLACGYLGMVDGLEPTDPIKGSAYRLRPDPAAADARGPAQAAAVSGRSRTCSARTSSRSCWRSRRPSTRRISSVISSWEREHLLLNV